MTAAGRLAAILAADVAGCSRLMGENEACTAKSLAENLELARSSVSALLTREAGEQL